MLTVTAKNFNDDSSFASAVNILKQSGVIAFPTETVYGLGCNMYDDKAIEEIYKIKGREFNKPLSAHISLIDQVHQLSDDIPDEFYLLAEAFLPGPLAIILKKSKKVSNLMTANLDTIGIRFPDDAICNKLISMFGVPLAATSANISGNVSPITGENVMEQLNGKIPLLLDNGETKYKKESTIISLAGGEPQIIRIGAIKISQIESVLQIKLN